MDLPFAPLYLPGRRSVGPCEWLSHGKQIASGPSSKPWGRGRLDGTWDLHSGGPAAVVDQRAQRTSRAGQQTILLIFLLSGFAGLVCEFPMSLTLVPDSADGRS